MAPRSLTVAVAGATGGIGSHAVRAAADAGYTVVALARKPERVPEQPGVQARFFDVTQPSGAANAIDGVDVVLSCLGNDYFKDPITASGTRVLLDQGVQKFIGVSSVGVGSSLDQCKRVSRVFAYLIRPLVLRRTFADLERMEAVMHAHPICTVAVRPVGLSDALGQTAGGYGVDDTVHPMVGRQAVAAFMVRLIEDDTWDNGAVTVSLANG